MTQDVVVKGTWAQSVLFVSTVWILGPAIPAAQAQDRRDGSGGVRGADRAGASQPSAAGTGGDAAGSSTPGADRTPATGKAAASTRERARVDRDVQAQLAPRLSQIRNEIREGRIELATREARRALALAEDSAGRRSQAAGDALEALIEARSAPHSSPGRDSRRLLERLVEIREPEGRGRWERPRRAGEGVLVARPARPDPAPSPAQPPAGASRDERRPERLPTPGSQWWGLRPPPSITPELCESLLGQDVPLTLRCMDALLLRAIDQGDMITTEWYMRQAARYRRGLHFASDLDTADNLFVLGSIEARLLEYPEARASLEQALELRQRRLGDRPLVAATMHELANVHLTAGRYGEARQLYERALAIWEASGSRSRLDVLTALDNLGQLLLTTGDYGGARRRLERALAVAESERGRNDPLVASSLISYATLLQSTGDFAGARQRYERARAILERKHGPDDPGLARLFTNLASLAIHAGDYERARAQLERALGILQVAVPENSPLVVPPLLGLARVRRLTGEADASPLLERALQIQENLLGPSHPVVASLLTELAQAKLAELFLAEEGLYLATRALAIRRHVFGGGHPLVGESLANVGDQWLGRGRPQMARPHYEEAVQVLEAALGPENPSLAHVLLRLALVRFQAGDERGALEAALRTERIGAAHLAATIGGLSEDEALRYSETRTSALDLALSLASVAGSEAAPAAWDSVIRSRAAVLDEMATRRRAVGTSPQAVAATQALRQASRHLAQLVVRATGADDGFDQYQRLITEARTKRDGAERLLAGIVDPGRRGSGSQGIGLTETLEALPARSALVAFARYRHFVREAAGSVPETSALPRTQPSFLAFVWSERAELPRVIPIGSASAVDALVERWRLEGARPLLSGGRGDVSERSYRAAAESLRRLVWDPIEPHVGAAERVFLVPDGSLNLLSWAALPVAETGYLVDGGPTIHYLSAERDLVGFAVQRRPSGRGLLAVGEPAFDDGRLFSAWGSSRGRAPASRAEASATQVAALRGASLDCRPLGAPRFEPLPGSGREAATIADLWDREPTAAGALRLTQNDATEAAFKRLASGRRVLHLATHGFFLDSRCATSLPGVRGVGGLVGPQTQETSHSGTPLRLAGLALAGANLRRWARPGEEDGVLTSEEIATLDLSGVEWAVLSACSTGVGTVRVGEGVLGLRRAFQVAGAHSLIMSLWPVEDEATARWMRALYRARLERGQTTDASVRSASREVLSERRRLRLDTHPYSWASFVAAGDWR